MLFNQRISKNTPLQRNFILLVFLNSLSVAGKLFARSCLLFFTLSIAFPLLAQDQTRASKRPKIGLVLSGGGAKGICHVGVLRVLEKAGIHVDYIAGASVGSIIGGMYAVGYSVDSIEYIVRNQDWSVLLTNTPKLSQISIEEKSEYGKYIMEIPLVQNRLVLPKGIIDAQSFSVELSRIFSVAYKTKRFSEFPIPFRCIATDITTGSAVRLDSGNLAEAIRASMAIPSIFSPVKYQGRLLVDGGIVRNFPVSDMLDMGADIVIGVNLSQGFLKENELQSVFDILNQSLFIVDNDDSQRQKKLCTYLIEPNMDNFGTTSFFEADSLIQRGYDAAFAQFDALRNLADSINRIFGPVKKEITILPDSVIINTIFIEGTKSVDPILVTGKLAIPKNTPFALNDIANRITHIYGTRYFNRISYELIPKDGYAQLRLITVENPNSYVKFALNQNTFTGSAFILNFTTRNTLGKRSRFYVTANISHYLRLRSEYFLYFGPKQDFGIGGAVYYDQNEYPIYQNLVKVSQYRQFYTGFDVKLQKSIQSARAYGIGLKREFISVSPEVFGNSLIYDGNIAHWNYYGYFLTNSHDRVYFPNKGSKTYIETSFIYDTRYHFSQYIQNPSGDNYFVSVPEDTLKLAALNHYIQFKFNTQKTYSISRSWVALFGINAYFSFNPYRLNRSAILFNNYVVGGLVQQFRNQISFVGVNEYQLNTNNFASVMGGIRTSPVRNFYITLRGNVGNFVPIFHSYYTTDALVQKKQYLTGFGLSFSYDSVLGPLEVTFMRSAELNAFSTYVNLGFNF